MVTKATGGVKLGTLDFVFLIASMATSGLIGLYFTNKNSSIESYMRGDRRLAVIPVAISLMTSCVSGLTLLGTSSEFYYQGPSFALSMIPALFCGPITAYTMLPVFYRLNELSLYRYLHLRFGLLIKYIVTTVFILQMVLYNSVVLYLPSMALESLLGFSRFYSILAIGLMCVAYSSIGGLKAVVWTDFLQAILMYSAIFIVGALGTFDAGGFKQVYELVREHGRLNLDGLLDLDITTRHTLVGFLFSSVFFQIYVVGVNQIQIQRSLSLPSLKQAQLAFVLCSLFTVAMLLVCNYLGAVLVSSYRSCDPYLAGQIPRRDAIIVHFVAHRLESIPGLRGIFVAGILSATLSTLSSFSNSMSALALEDYIRPALRLAGCEHSPIYNNSSRWTTYLVKTIAMLFGVICVVLAFAVGKTSSRLLQAAVTLLGATGVPFLGAFALGIFTRFTNTLGVLAGLAVTLSLGVYITIRQTFFHSPLEPTMPIYISDQCVAVFNRTLASSSLPVTFAMEPILGQARMPFRLDHISYMMLPCLQFTLMVVVGSLVSLVSGGWRQQVEDKYLVGMLQSKRVSKTI